MPFSKRSLQRLGFRLAFRGRLTLGTKVARVTTPCIVTALIWKSNLSLSSVMLLFQRPTNCWFTWPLIVKTTN